MSRTLAAVAYLAAMGGAGTLLASLPSDGDVQGLVFIVVALASVSLAGALTARWASPNATRTNQEDDRP